MMSFRTARMLGLVAGGGTNPGTADLLAWFPLDDASGGFVDETGNYDMVAANGGTVAYGETGKVSDAVAFSSNALGTVASGLGITAFPFTMSGWFKTSDTDGAFMSLTEGTASAKYFLVGLASGNLFIRARFNSLIDITGSAWPSDGEFHHVTAVFRSATDRELYLDGVSDAGGSGQTSVAIPSFNRACISGCFRNTGYLNLMDSTADEAAFFSDALTADEITWLYNDGAGRRYENLDGTDWTADAAMKALYLFESGALDQDSKSTNHPDDSTVVADPTANTTSGQFKQGSQGALFSTVGTDDGLILTQASMTPDFPCNGTGDGEITAAGWVYPAYNSNRYYLRIIGNGSTKFAIDQNPDYTLGYVLNGSSYQAGNTTEKVAASTLFFVGLVYSASASKVWVYIREDGSASGTFTEFTAALGNLDSINTTAAWMSLGIASDISTAGYNGTMDAWAIFNGKAMTQAELDRVFNKGWTGEGWGSNWVQVLDDSSWTVNSLAHWSGETWHATSFEANESGDVSKIVSRMLRVGNAGTYKLDFHLYSDSSGSPGSSLGAVVNFPYSDIPTINADIDFEFPRPPFIVSGETYWLVWQAHQYDAGNYLRHFHNGSGTGGVFKYSADGASWSVKDAEMISRATIYGTS